jgi:hypothetical protein
MIGGSANRGLSGFPSTEIARWGLFRFEFPAAILLSRSAIKDATVVGF